MNMFEIGYNVNDIVEHNDLCKRVKCGCMGGIRYSKENNALILFIKKNGLYKNVWHGDVLEFMGSGRGDQSIDKKTNRRLTYSRENETAVFLFEWMCDGDLKYLGRMVLDDKPRTESAQNKYGETETRIIYRLRKV